MAIMTMSDRAKRARTWPRSPRRAVDGRASLDLRAAGRATGSSARASSGAGGTAGSRRSPSPAPSRPAGTRRAAGRPRCRSTRRPALGGPGRGPAAWRRPPATRGWRRCAPSPGWTLVSRAISRAAWATPLNVKTRPGEIDHPDEQRQEDDDAERELDEGLAALGRRVADPSRLTGSPSRSASACRGSAGVRGDQRDRVGALRLVLVGRVLERGQGCGAGTVTEVPRPGQRTQGRGRRQVGEREVGLLLLAGRRA